LLGFPIIGDEKYDPEFQSRRCKPKTHLLRASQISFDGESFCSPTEGFVRSPCES
jgi:hypothetical protein